MPRLGSQRVWYLQEDVVSLLRAASKGGDKTSDSKEGAKAEAKAEA